MTKKLHIILIALLLSTGQLWAQDTLMLSVKNVAPAFGIQPRFMDDTLVVARYLDSLGSDNQSLTDTCVALNARVLAFQNVMLHDYRHTGDSVWMDSRRCLVDYEHYRQKLNDLSSFVLHRAHSYIENAHLHRETVQQNSFILRKDTIARLHRTIVNACEGFGVNDADRKKELKEIYYAYLSVYNRYDLSNNRYGDSYLDELDEFVTFQNHLINNLLGTGGFRSRIKNFPNTLRIRCGHTHSDVLRSYQRVSARPAAPVSFSTIGGYYLYIDSLQRVLHVQDCYLTVVDLREKITANSERINTLYGSRFRQVVKTYQEVVGSINVVPAFTTQQAADNFISTMKEFIKVQDCYLSDYNRLSLIKEHGDTIARRCAVRYSDVSKAYNKMVEELYPKSQTPIPAYRSIDDAARFVKELDYFEHLQRQYDTVILLRKQITDLGDSVSRGWMTHMTVYNGFQTIRKQVVLTPSFINPSEGSRFIHDLSDFVETGEKCLEAIRLLDESKRLDNLVTVAIQPYRNIRKAYSRLEKAYLTINAINHASEVYNYCRQLDAFITVQKGLLETAKGIDVQGVDTRLRNISDIDIIEQILGL